MVDNYKGTKCKFKMSIWLLCIGHAKMKIQTKHLVVTYRISGSYITDVLLRLKM